ncbi:MAG TPA: hypothetical protein VG871_10470 [Vicinamibacterales bacterium]|nr:hypothetical protein [Vicinamibacterales bacterium]
MNIVPTIVAALFALPLVGCSSDPAPDADSFPTFQACYDEHHGTEMFATPKAVEICCIDHPIGGAAANTVCGDSAASCQTYVSANLMDSADPTLSADIQAACAAYVTDRGM